jgi:glycosyltransferase involved in cell wall biosynthesis
MKILFLIPYPVKEAPSQRFRFEQYFHFLKENGFQISFQSFWDEHTWKILYKSGHLHQKAVGFIKGVAFRLTVLFQLNKIDFVFIHRECVPLGPPVIEWMIAKILKGKIIYDFDDAIWLPNTSEENKIVALLKWHRKVASICKWSHKVSCGNSFLANYASQFNTNVVVIPTTIDTANLHNPSNHRHSKKLTSVVIGWTGTQSTLPYLISLMPVLKTLEGKFSGKIRVLIIANKDPKLNLNFVDFIPWSKQTEVQDLLRIDIGIMPLTDDIWAKGKCGFKGLQYMALEIPALVSPVGVNTEIVDNGINGYWCASDDDWIESLEKLVLDKQLREKMGIAARKKVIDHYSVSSNSSTFLGLFS